MPDDPKDPTPAAATKPAHTIIKQKHSRWWEVRDPGNELVCTGRARERWCGGSRRETDQR